ncbi:hypothetical protein A3840_15870 [Devosia elaeis]|uniref:RepB plasmid partition domain-containing protein n=1 Tax=Devosia elaeis TaxID=1770058 RepID=A0A178HQY9_9HYPH|nr:hypothetical protein A3840_15870 [Devosia elaeis]
MIAQGQENAVRANLSFIEKAFYAGALTAQRYDNKVIMTALSITASTLSVLQSVAALPPDVLEMLGGAKSTGRNRWYELKRLLDRPALLKLARELVQDADLLKLAPDQRFEAVLKALKQSRRKPSTPAATKSAWQPDSKAFAAEITVAQRRFTLALKAKQGSEAADFGRYLSDRLEGLYRDFRQEETSERKHNR